MHIYGSVGPLECIFIALLASLMALRHLKRRRFSIVWMSGQCCHHEFHILNAIDGLTYVVIFEDSLRKPMLICDSCLSYYNNYKMRQMLGVSKVMTLNEYVGW